LTQSCERFAQILLGFDSLRLIVTMTESCTLSVGENRITFFDTDDLAADAGDLIVIESRAIDDAAGAVVCHHRVSGAEMHDSIGFVRRVLSRSGEVLTVARVLRWYQFEGAVFSANAVTLILDVGGCHLKYFAGSAAIAVALFVHDLLVLNEHR